jgi:phospholipase/carboxylesterase
MACVCVSVCECGVPHGVCACVGAKWWLQNVFFAHKHTHTRTHMAEPTSHILAPSPAPHTHTLIYLHGFTCSGADYVATPHFFRTHCAPLRVVLPDAAMLPITCYGGAVMRSWYDYLTDHEGAREDELDMATLHASCARLMAVVEQELELLGGDHSRLLLGGCSQGCATALFLLSEYMRERIGGFVGTVGHAFAPPAPRGREGWMDTPMFFYNSLHDDIMRWAWVEQTFERLQAAGAAHVRTATFEHIKHSETGEEEGKWITDFLRRVLPPG